VNNNAEDTNSNSTLFEEGDKEKEKIKHVVIYENQRWWMGLQWCDKMLS
jgi:hypothetical protein